VGSSPGDRQQPTTSGDEELDRLVSQWWDWSECGAALGVSASRVGVLIKEHQLAAVGGSHGNVVPAELVADGVIVKGVPGVLNVLHDGGYNDREAIVWLFTEDETIPGRPIDALRENRGREVRRRAQAMAF
jgi:hypothetical protein